MSTLEGRIGLGSALAAQQVKWPISIVVQQVMPFSCCLLWTGVVGLRRVAPIVGPLGIAGASALPHAERIVLQPREPPMFRKSLVLLAALALTAAPAIAKTAPAKDAHALAVPFIADDYETALK